MASVGTLSVDLQLQSSNFIQNMKKAQDQSNETANAIKEHMDTASEAVKGLAEAFAVDWIKDKIEESLEYAESIKKVSEATGTSTKFVQQWTYAGSQFGATVESSQKSLEKFTKNLGMASQTGGTQYLRILKDLGVTSNNTEVALKQTADGLSKLNNPAKVAADVTQLFGREANDLIPLLEQGSKGFDELADAADQLGVVMSDQLINNSVQAEHKLSALKLVLDAEWAKVVADNANSIVSLSNGIIDFASALGKFWSQHPSEALGILGAIGGGIAGGLPGAAAGAIGGIMLGNKVKQDEFQQNPNWVKANDLYNQIHDARSQARHAGDTNATDRKFSHAETTALRARTTIEQHILNGGGYLPGQKPPGVEDGEGGGNYTLPDLPTHKKKQHADHTAEKLAREQQRDDEQFGRSYQSAQMGVLQSQEGLTQDPSKLGDLKAQEDQQQYAGKIAEIMRSTYSTDAAENTIRKYLLTQATDQAHQNEQTAIQRQKQDAIDAENLSLKLTQLDIAKGDLQSRDDLATTAAERRKVEKQILDIQYQEKEAQLQNLLAQQKRDGASPTAVANTQAQINALGKQHANDNAVVDKNTMGPLESYLSGIPKTADEINESLQNVAVDGLQQLTDGLSNVIAGTESVGDAFRDMATSIIKDLAKIVIEEAIVKPLAGMLGSAFHIPGLGGHANGGLAQAGTYLVGERGPEVLSVGAPASVMSTNALQAIQGGSQGVTINSTVQGVNDPAMVRRTSAETLAQAAPTLMKMSSNQTMAQSRYPRMR